MNNQIITINIISSSSQNSTSPLSELLIHPVTYPSASNTPIAPKRSARLLTSDESLAMLEEKEKGKRDALIETDRKKAEHIAKTATRRTEKKERRES